jgi:hypothetical protein
MKTRNFFGRILSLTFMMVVGILFLSCGEKGGTAIVRNNSSQTLDVELWGQGASAYSGSGGRISAGGSTTIFVEQDDSYYIRAYKVKSSGGLEDYHRTSSQSIRRGNTATFTIP